MAAKQSDTYIYSYKYIFLSDFESSNGYIGVRQKTLFVWKSPIDVE